MYVIVSMEAYNIIGHMSSDMNNKRVVIILE